MGNLTSAPRGTQDVLPANSYKWKYIERAAAEEAKAFGYREIRTPVFEHTELFVRSVGDGTDVVQKEMYTFNDKGGRSVTLKPEGTAGVVRALLEHGSFNDPMPLKTYYIIPCFRYEKPQAGRFREFHQFGVEAFGSSSPLIDAEIISLGQAILTRLGVPDIHLEINSIGCPQCREKYRAALREYFESRKDQLCETCLGRLNKNPMRILDCKNPECAALAKDAPRILSYLCEDCREHFDGVKQTLDMMEIPYTVNPTIVRGLDYYTRTVFEFITTSLGSQSAVCGGGRYDGLVQELGGPAVPALGFGMGLERLLLLMEKTNCPFEEEAPCDIYIGSMGEEPARAAAKLAVRLRAEFGVYAECDLMGRGVKAQMKYANKIGARFSAVIGENELEQKKITIKNMVSGETKEMALDKAFVEKLADFMAYEQLYNSCQDIETMFRKSQEGEQPK